MSVCLFLNRFEPNFCMYLGVTRPLQIIFTFSQSHCVICHFWVTKLFISSLHFSVATTIEYT